MFTTDQLIQIGLILVSIFGVIPLYYGLWQRRRNRASPFILQRFEEHTVVPIESNWSIRLLHSERVIEKCKILYQNYPLPWWDSDTCYYERFINKMGAGNVRLTKDTEKWVGEVVVMDGKKILKKIKLTDIPIVRA